MTILAIETSTSLCSLALSLPDGTIKLVEKAGQFKQAQFILDEIDALLASQSLRITDLKAIAYGRGPGSFTGTRIANSVAQGLAFATKLPVLPISSMATLAQTAYVKHSIDAAYVALKSQQHHIYWAVYHLEDGVMTLQGEELLIDISTATIPPKASTLIGIGDAWPELLANNPANTPENCINIDQSIYPSAGALITLALKKFAKGEWVDAASAQPFYPR